MRPYGIDLRWKSLVTLFAVSSATLSTVPARADVVVAPTPPAATPFTAPSTASPAAPTPPPVTPTPPPAERTAPSASAASPQRRPQPVELREVFWGGRAGELRHGKVPFQGGNVLEGADFYRALNREDLARSYDSRVAVRVVLASAGFLSILVGAGILASNMPNTQCNFVSMPYRYSPPQVVCATDSHDTANGIGVGLLVLSPLLGFACLLINPDPVSPGERQTLIDSYNASLGPPIAEAAPARPRRAAFSLAVEPTVSATGAGLTLGGRF